MHFLGIAVATLAALVSLGLNGLWAGQQGGLRDLIGWQVHTGILWIAAVAVSEAYKSLSPLLVQLAVRQRQWLKAAAGAGLMAVAVVWSVHNSVATVTGEHAPAVSVDTRLSEARATVGRIPPGEVPAVIEGRIAALLATPKLGTDCAGVPNGPVSRDVCPRVAAERGALATALERAAAVQMRDRLSALSGARPADVWGSAATWLPVALIELGSWLGFLVAGAAGGKRTGSHAITATDTPSDAIPAAAKAPGKATSAAAQVCRVADIIARVEGGNAVDGIRPSPGGARGSQRAWAAAMGVSVATARHELNQAAAAGLVVASSRQGTAVTRRPVSGHAIH